jgi:hypothetical protein
MSGEKNKLGEFGACEILNEIRLCMPVITVENLGKFKKMLKEFISNQ